MTNTLYRYSAYGLKIQSDMALPELEASAFDTPDVVIRRAELYRSFPIAFGNRQTFSPNNQQMDWGKVGRFEINGNNEILYTANEGTPDAIVRFPLLGTVMAMLLQIRGVLGLHASAVVVNGHAVGFMGDKGAGKSTTAGIMVSNGKPLFADDLLAITVDPQIQCQPGFPQMKLTEASAELLQIPDVDVLEKIEFPGLDKRQHNLKSHFFNKAVPLGAIYVLQRGPVARVEQMDTTEAFQALMRYTHFKRFGAPALATGAGPTLMQNCAAVARTGRVRRLTVPDSLPRLHEMLDIVGADVGA